MFPVSVLDDAGPGSLRQAIEDANNSPGADVVDLTALSGAIRLTSGELMATEAVEIKGPGADALTIDAQHASRIFNFSMSRGDNTVSGLRLLNGATMDADQPGGAVYSRSFDTLTISQCWIAGSATMGDNSRGGAVFGSFDVNVIDSTVTANSTHGSDADGGGVVSWYQHVYLTRSHVIDNSTYGHESEGGGVFSRRDVYAVDALVEGNRTYGDDGDGGGIRAIDVKLTRTTLRDNRTEGEYADGGGAYGRGAVTVDESLIHGNSTKGAGATGGGVFFDGALSMTDSVVSDNYTEGRLASGGALQGSDEATILRSSLTGNATRGDSAGGGAMRFGGGPLSIVDSAVVDNRTMGSVSSGGGIWTSYDTTIERSTFRGNSVQGEESYGGGLRADEGLVLLDSVVSGNTTAGYRGFGGGLLVFGEGEIARTAITGNSTTGSTSSGGGLYAGGPMAIVDSAIWGNSTIDSNSAGGGVVAFGTLDVTQSTVSGNCTNGLSSPGGGIAAVGPLTVRFGTIAENRTTRIDSPGGGIWSQQASIALHGTIVAANVAANGYAPGPDIGPSYSSLQANYSLIEQSPLHGLIGSNNILGREAKLKPLGNYGGTLPTHALGPDSPAVNRGDPLVAAPPAYDQRGEPFSRIAAGRMDIGAVEDGGGSADFDEDGVVGGLDFLTWQRNHQIGSTRDAGDADGDQDVDEADLAIWRVQYGGANTLADTFPLDAVVVTLSSAEQHSTSGLVDETGPSTSVTVTAIGADAVGQLPAARHGLARDEVFAELNPGRRDPLEIKTLLELERSFDDQMGFDWHRESSARGSVIRCYQ